MAKVKKRKHGVDFSETRESASTQFYLLGSELPSFKSTEKENLHQ